jgi:hypothetical protein
MGVEHWPLALSAAFFGKTESFRKDQFQHPTSIQIPMFNWSAVETEPVMVSASGQLIIRQLEFQLMFAIGNLPFQFVPPPRQITLNLSYSASVYAKMNS